MILFLIFSSIEILKMSSGGVELKIKTPIAPQHLELLSQEKNLLQLFPEAKIFGEKGDPILPWYEIWIGVPQEGKIFLDYSFTLPVDINNFIPSFIQYPGIGEGVEPSLEEYNFPPIYPKATVDTMTRWYRDHRVIILKVSPCIYYGREKVLRIYKEIDLKVKFEKPPKPLPYTPSPIEFIYKEKLINYEICKTWKRLFKKDYKNPFAISNVWIKVITKDFGVYKIDYETLKKSGIDLSFLDPRTLKLYNIGEYKVNEEYPDTLTQIPIYVHGEKDGTFDKEDYILFYDKGANHWIFGDILEDSRFFVNPYTNHNVYWLTFGGEKGKRMEKSDVTPKGKDGKTTAYSIIHLEEDNLNPGRAGLLWVWEEIEKEAEFNFSTQGICKLKRLKGEIYTTTAETGAVIFLNEEKIAENPQIPESRRDATIPWKFYTLFEKEVKEKEMVIKVKAITKKRGEAKLYPDFFELLVERKLSLRYSPFFCYMEKDTEYEIHDLISSPILLDITDPLSPYLFVNWDIKEGKLVLNNKGKNRVVWICAMKDAKKPIKIERVIPDKIWEKNWKVHYLVVSPDYYQGIGEGYLRYREDRVKIPGIQYFRGEIVFLSDIFNGFGYGIEEPMAIKRFFDRVYNMSEGRLLYTTFLGDGTYDYKNRNESFFPIYTEGKTLDPDVLHRTGAVWDSWFVDFDGSGTTPEIVQGRIPVQNRAGLSKYISKLKNYETTPFGEWVNKALFLGDDLIEGKQEDCDEIWPKHIPNCEAIAQLLPPGLRKEKVYLTEYRLMGGEKPDAHKDLVKKLSAGALFWIFFGHGNGYLLTHEHVIDSRKDEHLNSIRNGKKLFLAYLGTCGAGRFEDTKYECTAEKLIRSNEGAIVSIASTKATYSQQNLDFASTMFSHYVKYPGYPFGIFYTAAIPHNREAMFFGEPTLIIPYIFAKLDSLHIPEEFVEGERYTISLPVNSSKGTWQANLYGPDSLKHYRDNCGSVDYILPGNLLSKGNGSVINDSVKVTFVVPLEIEYGKSGWFYLLLSSKDSIFLFYRDSIRLKPSENPPLDSVGPLISLKADGVPIVEGLKVKRRFTLKGILSDRSGINVTGKRGRGGHRFELYVNDPVNSYQLNEYFEYYPNTDTIGSFDIELELPKDENTLYLWAIDNLLNESHKKVVLKTLFAEKLELKNPLVYPNPVKERAWFTFQLSKNAKVTIRIFTVKGRPIRTIERFCHPGFNKIEWDGKDKAGFIVSNGVYLYKISAESAGGISEKERVEYKGSFIIIH